MVVDRAYLIASNVIIYTRFVHLHITIYIVKNSNAFIQKQMRVPFSKPTQVCSVLENFGRSPSERMKRKGLIKKMMFFVCI